ncbi:MAG: hypothetical protein J7556_18555 [Acidovorax sp.]|nr:hypothetical protein [Acidovorax sp.]
MSLFGWFSRKPAPPKPRSGMEPSGLLNADATVPLAPGRAVPPPSDPAANRKNERMERRELLYTVVRDAMVRAGVLSASYKFKVLSLDQRGRQFLVMVDLAHEYGGETTRLSEIEALIAQTAKARFDILVTAVYWRINDHVAVGQPQKGATAPAVPPSLAPRPMPRPVAPPVVPPVAAPASPVITSAPPATPVAAAPLLPARPAPRFEPIEADEVAAFKRALTQAAAAAPVAAPPPPGVAVRTGPLMQPSTFSPTGFEDTEMPESDSHTSDLSRTQYGDLN